MMPGMPQGDGDSLLTLRLLGACEALAQGKPLPPMRYRRDMWLLALLVLRHDHEVARAELAALLWPDAAESLAFYYLRRSLSNLRHALGAESHRILTPSPRTLRLDLSGADCDLLAFDAAIQRAQNIEFKMQRDESEDAARSILQSALQEAVALYRGPLLPDCLEEWVLTERAAREQARLAALERLAQITQAQGEPAAAVHWLRLLLAADPYRESACQALMQTLADCGDMAAVTQVYRDMRLLLRCDLNADPSPDSQALYRSLQARGPRSAAFSPVSDAPAGPTRRLPIPLTDLVGREEEREEVCGWLSKSRLVTLVGTGGVGKTRLSLAVAEQMVPQFADGVWFVDLAPVSDPNLLAQTVLRTLSLREIPHGTAEETLEQALSSRMLLLVLDNCEHLLEACGSLTHRLLSASPGLRALATSREALGLTGEQIYRVPSLSLPPLDQIDREKSASSLLEYGAAQLFVERARQANPSFRLSRDNAVLIAQTCHRLDGIPLAMEMAAARVKSLSIAQIAARLDDRFHLLTGGSRAALPRQRTLQAAVDWSCDLLTHPERVLFRRLSVFAGRWSLEAAEAVCAASGKRKKGDGKGNHEDSAEPQGDANAQAETLLPSGVLDILTALVEKSLVVFEEAMDGAARYHLLETMREYGRERLAEAGEAEALRNRHCDFYLQLAEEIEPRLYGPEQGVWYDCLEREYNNLRAALEWCHREANGDRALRFAIALSAFWDVRGYFKEGQAHQVAALARESSLGAAARARALLSAGQLCCRQSDFVQGHSFLEECLAIQRALGNGTGIAGALNDLAHVALHQSDYDRGNLLGEESLAISQGLGDIPGSIGALNVLGHLARHQGDLARAGSHYEACLTIQRELGDTRGIAGSLYSLGEVACNQGRFAQARALCEEGLRIQRELGEKMGIIHSLGMLGRVTEEMGDYAQASALYRESLALRRELGDIHLIAGSLEVFAGLAGRQGRSPNAEDPGSLMERSARLLGAAEKLCQMRGGSPPASNSEEYALTVATVRAMLGEEAFVAAWEKGRAMSLEQMVVYALA